MSPVARALLAIALLVAAVVPAHAGDALVERARQLAPDAPETAARLLRSVLEGDDTTPELRVEAARAALETLPERGGNGIAGELVLSILRENRSHPAGWRTAFGVRDAVLDGLDLENGVPFLREMIALYPTEIIFRHHLTDLYMEAGRPGAARAECDRVLRHVPDDVNARYVLAELDELDGHAREAITRYEEIIELTGDLWAHELRVRVLVYTLGDYPAARLALSEAWAAVKASPPGAERDRRWSALESVEGDLDDMEASRAKLAEHDAHLGRLLLGVLAGWIVALAGGITVLRRRRLI